ncbi:MAG: hypothetical protein KBT28_02160 [Bacteroidales bacterium]|nr:hypothetical protein [Candidatus Colimorpha merdihippi]
MKQIFLAIQDRLSSLVPSLQYIDKNWGQLNLPQPPVKWPCCLIDLDTIDYSMATNETRLAEASIILTIADHHTVRSSAQAPAKANAYDILDLIEDVISALDGWRVPDTTQALIRTRLAKTYSDQSYDVYSLTFSTAWIEQIEEGQTTQASPSISINLDIPN